jgi:hypothetical protein
MIATLDFPLTERRDPILGALLQLAGSADQPRDSHGRWTGAQGEVTDLRRTSHALWQDPEGRLYDAEGDHPEWANRHLDLRIVRSGPERNDLLYAEMARRGWNRVTVVGALKGDPRPGERIISEGDRVIYADGPLNPAQRAVLERHAIEHELTLIRDRGILRDPLVLYAPPGAANFAFGLLNAAEGEARDERGRWTGVNWDADHGAGATPAQKDLAYFGFERQMKPREYLSLVRPGPHLDDSKVVSMEQSMRAGQPFAPPLLSAKWRPEQRDWAIDAHDGRHRALALHRIDSEAKMPVHILPRNGLRARDLTPEMRAAPFVHEGLANFDALGLALMANFDPDQPRDDHGRFATTGAVVHRQCAWCRRDLGDVPVAADDPAAGQTSHGICEDCSRQLVAESAPAGARVRAAELGMHHDVPADPAYAYHVTSRERLQDITESGRLEVHRPDYGTDQSAWPDRSTEKRAYFTAGRPAVEFAPEDGRPVAVRAPLAAGFHRESTGDLYRTQPLDARHLEYWGEDRAWHPVPHLARPPA